MLTYSFGLVPHFAGIPAAQKIICAPFNLDSSHFCTPRLSATLSNFEQWDYHQPVIRDDGVRHSIVPPACATPISKLVRWMVAVQIAEFLWSV
jgi:hypothetical protein